MREVKRIIRGLGGLNVVCEFLLCFRFTNFTQFTVALIWWKSPRRMITVRTPSLPKT